MTVTFRGANSARLPASPGCRRWPALVFALLLAPSAARADQPDDTPGRIALDARAGAAFSLVGQADSLASPGQAMLAVSLSLGIAITPDRRGRLLLAPELVYTQFSVGTTDPTGAPVSVSSQLYLVSVPLGFEYDIPVARVPGLSIYPQVLIGYASRTTTAGDQATFTGGVGSVSVSQGMAALALGLRYVWRGRIDFAFEPVGIPVYFGGGASTLVLYRALASIGATF